MLTLTRQADYAIQFVSALIHERGTTVLSLRQFAKHSGISLLFLQRIVTKLRHAGIVESVKGSNGGYRLARKTRPLTIQDVVEAIDGPVSVALCVREPGMCVFETRCTAKKMVERLNYQIAQLLRRVRVSDV